MDRAEVFAYIADVRTGMVGLNGRHLPMSHTVLDDALYFMTARGTDVAAAGDTRATGHYIICSDAEGFYADITGRFAPVTDRARIDALWSPLASAWFDKGRDDPDLRVVVFHPARAEVWTSASAPVFFFQIAKANLTGTPPDAGDTAVILF